MSDYRVVFVGGVGRSGSTLVERLLGELGGTCSVGEVVHLWRRGLVDNERCGCGEPFLGCPFWSAVGERAFGGWDRIDAWEVLALKDSVDRTRYLPRLLRSRPAPGMRRDLERYTGLYDQLYRAIAACSGCRVVVDSSKHASLAACLHWRLGPRIKVLHMLRDPRAVAYSWLKRVPRVQATARSAEREMARRPAGATAMNWVVQNAAFSVLARRGVATWRMRYEEFARTPRAAFAEAAEFLGCRGQAPFSGARTARLGGSHALSGNPMRTDHGEVAVRSDESWRSGLGLREQLLVSVLTSPVRPLYGY